MPGQLGNAVFAGHRVTHSHPFRRINELVPGDEIIFKMDNGTFTYKMTTFADRHPEGRPHRQPDPRRHR